MWDTFRMRFKIRFGCVSGVCWARFIKNKPGQPRAIARGCKDAWLMWEAVRVFWVFDPYGRKKLNKINKVPNKITSASVLTAARDRAAVRTRCIRRVSTFAAARDRAYVPEWKIDSGSRLERKEKSDFRCDPSKSKNFTFGGMFPNTWKLDSAQVWD